MNKWTIGALAALALLAGSAGQSWATAAAGTDHAEVWDKVWHHVLLDLTVIGTIFLLISVYFMVVYARKNANDVGQGPTLSFGTSLAMGLVPAFIFMADDFFLAAQGWHLWNVQRRVPEGAYEIKVNGRMWGWDFEYPNGVSTSNEVLTDNDGKVTGVEGDGLVVPVGKPVVLRMVSNDVVHAFFIPKHRIKEDLMPGRITYIWFLPKAPGKQLYTCTEYCGASHSRMYGYINALPQAEFDQWVASKAAPAAAPADAAAAPAADAAAAPAADAAAAAPAPEAAPAAAPAH